MNPLKYMRQKIQKLGLETQLSLSFLGVAALVLVLALSVTLLMDFNSARASIDDNIISISSYVASLDSVSEMIEAGYPNSDMNGLMDGLYESFPNISAIAIYNEEGLRFYHTSRAKTGDTYVSIEQVRESLQGDRPIATGYGTMGDQRFACREIIGSDGKIIGYVMVAVFSAYLDSRVKSLISVYLMIGVVMLVISLLLSQGLVHLLRDSLMGYHPAELLDLYLEQGYILDAMSAGLVASDKNGRLLFANQTAMTIFPQMEVSEQHTIQEYYPQTTASEVLKTGQGSDYRHALVNNHHLIISEYPMMKDRSPLGVLTILSDRTELVRLSDELTGARSMTDTLRSFNHEFMNKLHVILGYLQIGEIDSAISYITHCTLVTSQAIRQVATSLRVSSICALVIGKMMHAAEHGILVTVTPDSSCIGPDLLLPEEDYITIIGNLLENAIEELSASDQEVKEITLGIYFQEDCNIIVCEDTGRGIPEEAQSRILEQGYSTKGSNRGTGLFLISRIIESNHGTLSIDTEEGEGTCFTITFTRNEEEGV